MQEKDYIMRSQQVVLISSVIFILLLGFAWYFSGPGQEWKKYQKQYLQIEESISDTSDYKISLSKFGIKQIAPEGINVVDRCISCHIGMENPYMKDAPLPLKTHPGSFLKNHPPEDFACTICHGGQGRATNAKEAHAVAEDVFWEHPILSDPYLESSCGKCHLSIFDEEDTMLGTEVFAHGQDIFNTEGCLGCHKARGVGGIVGPDLTEQGEKTRSEYSFEHIESEQTITNWLKEHFRDPEMVSPGSQMLKIDLPEDDLEALSTFVLGLVNPEISFALLKTETLLEFKGERNSLRGEDVFSMFCSACHGKQGEGKDYEDYKYGTPGILGEDFLRVSSEDFLRFTIEKGRSLRQMASWVEEISGLTEKELSELVLFVINEFSGNEFSSNINKLSSAKRRESIQKGSQRNGKELFERYCESCHGPGGQGDVAVALNNPDFLRNADDFYLQEIIQNGRRGDAMPAWDQLGEESVGDLLAFLRSFGAYRPFTVNINFNSQDIEDGRLKYHFNCSRCHGESGQGQTGPALINQSFLLAAADEFLYNTIANGRDQTSMFGWSTDVFNNARLNMKDIGNIVAFLREKSKEQPDYLYAGANPGNKNIGKELYANSCAECHGNDGAGEKAPALNNQEFLSAASNGYILATMTVGRANTAMPAWGYGTEDDQFLSGKDREHIVAWIRNWERIRIGF